MTVMALSRSRRKSAISSASLGSNSQSAGPPDLNQTSGANGARGVSLPRTFSNAVCPELVEGPLFLLSVAEEQDCPSTSSGRTVLGSEAIAVPLPPPPAPPKPLRQAELTSELPSLMRKSYAV